MKIHNVKVKKYLKVILNLAIRFGIFQHSQDGSYIGGEIQELYKKLCDNANTEYTTKNIARIIEILMGMRLALKIRTGAAGFSNALKKIFGKGIKKQLNCALRYFENKHPESYQRIENHFRSTYN